MSDAATGLYVAVISSGRPRNVARMQQALRGLHVCWYVGQGEGPEYGAAGARDHKETGGLCRSRNAALEDAFAVGGMCAQVSDDLQRIGFAIGKSKGEETTLKRAIATIAREMRRVRARLGGVAPTANGFYFDSEKPVRTAAFVVGDLIVVNRCELRFDEELTLKEDYDYTLQHLMRYGVVARCDYILAEFRHRTNRGGVNRYRTAVREQDAIRYLRGKWGRLIRDNPRRRDEILLRLAAS